MKTWKKILGGKIRVYAFVKIAYLAAKSAQKNRPKYKWSCKNEWIAEEVTVICVVTTHQCLSRAVTNRWFDFVDTYTVQLLSNIQLITRFKSKMVWKKIIVWKPGVWFSNNLKALAMSSVQPSGCRVSHCKQKNVNKLRHDATSLPRSKWMTQKQLKAFKPHFHTEQRRFYETNDPF